LYNAVNYKAATGTENIPNRVAYQSHSTFTNYKCNKNIWNDGHNFSLFFSCHQANGQSIEKYSNMFFVQKEKS